MDVFIVIRKIYQSWGQNIRMGFLAEVSKIKDMLSMDEEVLFVERQSRYWPGGSAITPNVIIATTKRLILRNPIYLGLKANIIDIPYEIITSVKLKKGVFTSTIMLESFANRNRLGLIAQIEDDDSFNGIIEAIPKQAAQKLVEIIRRGIRSWA